MAHPVSVTQDVSFGPDPMQALDLYRPDVPGPVPVVAYLHGGGWQLGDKAADAKERLQVVAAHGIAVASLNYRLVPQAVYPAQIQDAMLGISWLRSHGSDHGLDTRRIGIWGASAGGYLATMVGLTAGNPAFAPAGPQGADAGADSQVHAVVDWFSQSDLVANTSRSWLEQEILAEPFERPFLAADDEPAFQQRAAQASPLNHVHAQAPPFLIVHGDRDRVTPIAQSAALHDALVRAGVSSTFVTLGGAGHESHTFDEPAQLAMTAAFLLQHLRGRR